jgi:8-oxo-dGTP pyrophosphatase MutT (NUDIX family)
MQNKSIQKRKRYVPPESGPPKAATAIIIRSDGNFLSLLPHSAKNPKWEEPGGRIDTGETALQCAVRETREETGIDLTDASFRLIGWVYSKWPKANVYVFIDDVVAMLPLFFFMAQCAHSQRAGRPRPPHSRTTAQPPAASGQAGSRGPSVELRSRRPKVTEGKNRAQPPLFSGSLALSFHCCFGSIAVYSCICVFQAIMTVLSIGVHASCARSCTVRRCMRLMHACTRY